MIEYLPWSKIVLQNSTESFKRGKFAVLDIELGGQCNYHCIYCDSPQRDKKCTVNISQVESLIKTGTIKWVYICGLGEPTVESNKPYLIKILDICETYQAKCSIFTNLSLLDDTLLHYVEKGVLYLLFKYDSQSLADCTSIYNQSQVELQLHNIERIKKYVVVENGCTNIAASIVPTQINKGCIKDVVQDCLSNGIYPLIAELEQSGDALENYEQLALSRSELQELKNEIEAIIGEPYSIPLCPAVFCGIHVRYDGTVTVDESTGLSCPWFWLKEPTTVKIGDFNKNDVSSVLYNILKYRQSREHEINSLLTTLEPQVFGGCGGDLPYLLRKYIEIARERRYTMKDANSRGKTIYLDNNATTPLSESVQRIIKSSLSEYFNPSTLYEGGKQIENEIKKARESVAALINADKDSVIFNSGATEGNNTVLNHVFFSTKEPNMKKHIIVSNVEHPAILETVSFYEKHNLLEVTRLPVDHYGRIDKEYLLSSLKSNTVLVSIMLANNEIGNIYPIQEFAKIVHSFNPSISVHTDATQAIGKMKVDVEALGVDFLTLSGHKFYAPKGVGALFVRSSKQFIPFIHGGHQENRKRAGTENTVSIIAMGEAAREAAKFADSDYEKIASLRDDFEERLKKVQKDAEVLGDSEHRICNTSCIRFPGINGKDICEFVDLEARICISTGSACDSNNLSLSHVMRAMNVQEIPIRVSLGRDTTQEDMIKLLQSLMMYRNRKNPKARA